MKKIISALILAIAVLSLVACGSSSPTWEAFGNVETISVLGGTATAAIVPTDRNLLTDDELVEFFHAEIYDSGHNWFTLDFGDGTGYVFRWSGNRFSHTQLESEGRMGEDVGGSGYILADSIQRTN